jgi:two-component system response regulator YesN
MYKILIADDEAMVREGIRDMMNWHELGYELVGAFENGREVIRALDDLHPDVVLTDINMPFVDGLELSRYLFEHFPRTKVIILTGYDEFDYAQQALKLKVHDFIVKPNTAQELREILSKVKEDLDEEARKLDSLSQLKMQLRESLPLLRERCLNQLVSGSLHSHAWEEKLAYLNICLQGPYYLAAIIDMDDHGELIKVHPGNESDLLYFAVYNISGEIVGKEGLGIVFQNYNEKTIVLLCGDHPDPLRDKAMEIFEEISHAVKKYLMFTVSIGVGDVCGSLKEISTSYKRAVSALDYRFLLGKNRVIRISDMEGTSHSVSSSNKQHDRMLVSAMKTGTPQELEQSIASIIQYLKESYLSINRCYIHIQQLIISIINTLHELGIDENQLHEPAMHPLTAIYQLNTLDEVEAWLQTYCAQASRFILEQRDSYSKVQAQKAEAFIMEHYMDVNISLNAVCKHLNMSTSYFSSLFKNYTGETLVSYLTRVRVEKAKELLKHTDLKSYAVADRVGYADPYYFSSIFKKATGMTATEYRTSVGGEHRQP